MDRKLTDFIHDPHSKLARQQEANEEVSINDLDVGTKIVVHTSNTEYYLEVLGDGKVRVKGGKYFPEFTEIYFNGCTFGGSLLLIGKISPTMFMEFQHPEKTQKVITTSQIKSITLLGQDWGKFSPDA